MAPQPVLREQDADVERLSAKAQQTGNRQSFVEVVEVQNAAIALARASSVGDRAELTSGGSVD